MINYSSVKLVNGANFNRYFKRPLYDSYCFSNINNLIEYVLGINKKLFFPEDVFLNLPKLYDQVIFFLIDGFGWRFYKKFENHPFFLNLKKGLVINKLTSQFPSTTSAHVTKIHTGFSVGESGVFEWNYYEPRLDQIITPLLFSKAGDDQRDTLESMIRPEEIFPKNTFYEKLKNKSINCFVFQH